MPGHRTTRRARSKKGSAKQKRNALPKLQHSLISGLPRGYAPMAAPYEGKLAASSPSTTATTSSSSSSSSSDHSSKTVPSGDELLSELVNHCSSREFKERISRYLDGEDRAVLAVVASGSADDRAGHSHEALTCFRRWESWLDGQMEAFVAGDRGRRAVLEQALQAAAGKDEQLGREDRQGEGKTTAGGAGSSGIATSRMYFLQHLLNSWQVEGFVRLVERVLDGGEDDDDSED